MQDNLFPADVQGDVLMHRSDLVGRGMGVILELSSLSPF